MIGKEKPPLPLCSERRIEMDTGLGIRRLRTGTPHSRPPALCSAQAPLPYVEGMTDKPDPIEPGIPDFHVLPNEDGGADVYVTYLQEEDGSWLNRDLETYKKQLRHDDPMRARVLTRLRGQKLMKRLGVSVRAVRRDGRVSWQFEGPSQEAMEEALQWYKDHDYFTNLE